MREDRMGFSAGLFAERRARVRKALAGGILILPPAPVLRRPGGTEYVYRPSSELFYLTGSVDPGTVAVLRDCDEEGFVLFVPRPDPEVELWSGPRMGPAEAKEVLGPDAVFPLEELEDRLPPMLRAHRRVYFRLGEDERLEALVLQGLRWARARGARMGRGPRSVEDPGEILDPLRLVKDPEELQRIRRAAGITVSAFQEAMTSTRPGMGEWELEALLEARFRREGGLGPAFPTIAGSGGNGCVLHYVDNAHRLEAGELVLLDGGAEVDLYAGDVTRTFPVAGRFSDAQRDVYEVVLRGRDAALSAVGPGSTIEAVHRAAVLEMLEGLIGLGLVKGDPLQLLEEKAHEVFFPHRTSHWLGLDVHDVGDYVVGSRGRPLEPGMVFTVEPGLYFPRGDFESEHPYGGLGVRIEDDILVTEAGFENLTGSLPTHPAEVEALVGSGPGEESSG